MEHWIPVPDCLQHDIDVSLSLHRYYFLLPESWRGATSYIKSQAIFRFFFVGEYGKAREDSNWAHAYDHSMQSASITFFSIAIGSKGSWHFVS